MSTNNADGSSRKKKADHVKPQDTPRVPPVTSVCQFCFHGIDHKCPL